MTLPQASESEQLPIAAQVASYKDIYERMNLAIKTDLLPALVKSSSTIQKQLEKCSCVFPRGFPTPNKSHLLQLAEGILKSFIIAPSLG